MSLMIDGPNLVSEPERQRTKVRVDILDGGRVITTVGGVIDESNMPADEVTRTRAEATRAAEAWVAMLLGQDPYSAEDQQRVLGGLPPEIRAELEGLL
jgi:hypothetical protein